MAKTLIILLFPFLLMSAFAEEPLIIEISGEGSPDTNFTTTQNYEEIPSAYEEDYFGVNTISMPEVKKESSKNTPEVKQNKEEEIINTEGSKASASQSKVAQFFYKRTCFYGEGIVFDERPIINLPPQWPFKGSYVYLFPAGKDGYLKYLNFKCPAGTVSLSSDQKTPTIYGRGGNVRYGSGCFMVKNNKINADKDHIGIYCSGSVRR